MLSISKPRIATAKSILEGRVQLLGNQRGLCETNPRDLSGRTRPRQWTEPRTQSGMSIAVVVCLRPPWRPTAQTTLSLHGVQQRRSVWISMASKAAHRACVGPWRDRGSNKGARTACERRKVSSRTSRGGGEGSHWGRNSGSSAGGVVCSVAFLCLCLLCSFLLCSCFLLCVPDCLLALLLFCHFLLFSAPLIFCSPLVFSFALLFSSTLLFCSTLLLFFALFPASSQQAVGRGRK